MFTKKIAKEAIIKIAPWIYQRFKVKLNHFLNKVDKRVEEKWDNWAGWAIDVIDTKTQTLDENVWSSTIELPSSFRLDNGKVLNQWPTMWCCAVWATEARNEGWNMFDIESMEFIDTINYIRDNLDPDIDKDGTLVVNWPEALKQMGKIEDYYKCENTIEWFKKAIYLWGGVCTGTNKISWSKTGVNGVAVEQAGAGHFINITWWDDSVQLNDWFGKMYVWAFYIENTWWENWGLKWGYWLPYDIAMDLLFYSKYWLIVDKKKMEERTQAIINWEVQKLSDYESFLARGYIEQPRPERVLTEKLFGTLMERIFKDQWV